MKATFAFVTAVVASTWSPLVSAQGLPIQPGEYSVSAVTAAGSTDGVKPETATRCIKAEDLANPESVLNNRFMASFKPDATCAISNLSLGGGKVAYNTDCKYSQVQVSGSYTATSYSVVRKAKPKGASGPVAETRLEGKRTGVCK